MSVVEVLFNVIGPVAVLVALGAGAGPRLGIDASSLSRLAYWVFGPAFIFGLLANADLSGSVVAGLLAASFAGMAGATAVSVAWAVFKGRTFEQTAGMAIPSMWGNVGNAGLALVVFSLGDQALPLAAFLMVAINLTSLVISVGLAQARSSSPLAALVRGLTTPMSLAGGAALIVNLTGIGLPLLVTRSVDLLANALIPVMLFGLGLQLVSAGRPSFSADLAVVSAAKLIAAPAAAALVAVLVGLEGDARSATIIQSAMPPAVFTSVVATEHGLVPEQVTATVVTATLLSLITLPVVLVAL